MYTKTNHRIVKRVFALVLTMAMVASLFAIRISAAKADFDPPTQAMTVDKNLITVSAHSQAFLLPEIIGLTNTTSRNTELPDVFATNANDTETTMSLKEAQKTAILGVFGSNINANPNPYMYNYFYNTWATENEAELAPVGEYTLSTGIGNMFSPQNAANEGGITDESGMTIPVSIYLKQDILLGCNPRTAEKTGYTDVIAAYNQAKNDTYAPLEMDYEMSHVYSFLQNLYIMSDYAHQINDQNGKTWRYTDPSVISGDVEKFVKGLESYVMKKMKEDNVKPAVVAVVDTSYTTRMRQAGTIQNNEWVLNTKDCSTQQTTLYSRVAEFAADTTKNLVDEIGGLTLVETPADRGNFVNNFYKVTSDQIAEKADLVLFTDVTGATTNEASDRKVDEFKQDLANTLNNKNLTSKVEDLEMMTSAFDCVGSIGANSVENLLGMAYFTAYVYPQYLNQFEVAAYWYNNFYHISNLNKLKSTMASNFATSSVRKGYESRNVKSMNYDKAAIEALCVEGMNYYENNKEEFKGKLIDQNGKTGEATGWDIDWTVGIGEGQKEEPKPVTPDEPATVLNGLTKGTDGRWAMYNNNAVVANYTGLAKSTYNNQWYYVKNGYLDWNYTGFGKNLTTGKWYRVKGGRVDWSANGIYKNPDNGVWYKAKDGRVTFNETGVFKNYDNNTWWRVKNSRVDFSANSIYKNNSGWWKTKNGKVTFNENGIFSNENGSWKVKNSKVDFGFSGKYQGKTIKNGKVV